VVKYIKQTIIIIKIMRIAMNPVWKSVSIWGLQSTDGENILAFMKNHYPKEWKQIDDLIKEGNSLDALS
jgi:hypothetical protein